MAQLSDNQLVTLAEKAYKDVYQYAFDLIRATPLGSLRNELNDKIKQHFKNYRARMTSFTFVEHCEGQFNDSIKFAEYLIDVSPEDRKHMIEEIKDQINSYITIMKLSNYRRFTIIDNVGMGYINPNGISKIKI